jgi:predicted dehydrogenase
MCLVPKPSRRTFLATTTAAAATLVNPARALAGNEILQIGLIGTGGRCRHLMGSLQKMPDVRMIQLCDIYDEHLAQAAKLADPKATTTKRYRDVLDNKQIDAVLIASPDHWHAPMTLHALEAGKDVYVEKPLTHKLEEGPKLLEAVKKYARIVQVGTQQRSMPQFEKGRELVRQGKLGRVFKVHLTWNRNVDRIRRTPLNIDPNKVDWKAFLGNAPERPFDEYRFRNWRWFWDYGGGLFTDLMVHFLDVAHWFLDLDHPLQATSIGSHIASAGIWETPDTVQTLLTYPDGLQVHFGGTFSNAREAAHIVFMGTDASLYLDRGRYELLPERGKGQPEELVLGQGPRGRDFYETPDGEYLHLRQWIESIRNRKQPSAPIAAGVSSASAAQLANKALRAGQVVNWEK